MTRLNIKPPRGPPGFLGESAATAISKEPHLMHRKEHQYEPGVTPHGWNYFYNHRTGWFCIGFRGNGEGRARADSPKPGCASQFIFSERDAHLFGQPDD